MTKPTIFVATPCYGGLLTRNYVVSLMQTMVACQREGISLHFNFLGGESLITRARSQLTSDFLEIPTATHLLFIDADISFAPEQLMRLLGIDKDVAAAMYPVKDIFWDKLAARANEGEPLNQAGLLYTAQLCTGEAARTEDDFATAEYAATGFLLIKRVVIERMIAAHPELKFRYLDVPRQGQLPRDTLYALFDCMIDPANGQYLSEDYSFCRRWRKIGGEIWVDLRSKLTHEGNFRFHGDTAKRYGAKGS